MMFGLESTLPDRLQQNQALPRTQHDGLCPARSVELTEDRADVKLDRMFRDLQTASDRFVSQPFRHHR